MIYNKKAQIGETMTWVVATLIIIFILAITIFSVSNLSFAGGRKLLRGEKEKDFVSTVSATNFLRNDNNFDVIKNAILNGDVNNKLKPLFDKFSEKTDPTPYDGYDGCSAPNMYGGGPSYKRVLANVVVRVSYCTCGAKSCYKTKIELPNNIELDFNRVCGSTC